MEKRCPWPCSTDYLRDVKSSSILWVPLRSVTIYSGWQLLKIYICRKNPENKSGKKFSQKPLWSEHRALVQEFPRAPWLFAIIITGEFIAYQAAGISSLHCDQLNSGQIVVKTKSQHLSLKLNPIWKKNKELCLQYSSWAKIVEKQKRLTEVHWFRCLATHDFSSLFVSSFCMFSSIQSYYWRWVFSRGSRPREYRALIEFFWRNWTLSITRLFVCFQTGRKTNLTQTRKGIFRCRQRARQQKSLLLCRIGKRFCTDQIFHIPWKERHWQTHESYASRNDKNFAKTK